MCSQFYLYLKGSCTEGSKTKLYKSYVLLKTALFYFLYQKFVLLKMDYLGTCGSIQCEKSEKI